MPFGRGSRPEADRSVPGRISRAVADEPTLVTADGLHPSPAQHDRWLDRIHPLARSVLDGWDGRDPG